MSTKYTHRHAQNELSHSHCPTLFSSSWFPNFWEGRKHSSLSQVNYIDLWCVNLLTAEGQLINTVYSIWNYNSGLNFDWMALCLQTKLANYICIQTTHFLSQFWLDAFGLFTNKISFCYYLQTQALTKFSLQYAVEEVLVYKVTSQSFTDGQAVKI